MPIFGIPDPNPCMHTCAAFVLKEKKNSLLILHLSKIAVAVSCGLVLSHHYQDCAVSDFFFFRVVKI